MKKDIIGIVILLVTLIFPFKWAFIDHPYPVKVNDNFVEPNAMLYMFFWILCFAGYMTAFLLMTGNKEKKA